MMRIRLLSAVAAMMLAATMPSVAAETVPVPVQRMGLYAVTDDLARSRAFYVALFGAPRLETEGMIGFDVAGGLYAIVSRTRYAPEAKRGDSVRAYLKVADIATTFAQVRRVAPAALERNAITGEGAFRFFRLRDPDGNVIEFFSVG